MPIRRMYRPVHIVALVAMLVVVSSSDLHASPVLDQTCCVLPNGLSLFSELTRVQIFTVGLTGKLTGIDLGINLPGGNLPTFQLFAGTFANGQSIATFGNPLATLSPVNTGVALPNSQFGGTFFFSDLSGAGIFVTAGQMFSIVMGPGGGTGGLNGGGWVAIHLGDYFRGISLSTTVPSPTVLTSTPDERLSFRTSVDTAATLPEPATALLLLIGIGGIGFISRKNQGL